MSWGSPEFVLILIGIIVIGRIMRTSIRAKHGLPDYEEDGSSKRSRRRRDELSEARRADLLASENEQLKGQVGRLEERLSVLERIATDPSTRLSKEIEDLRDKELN